MTDDDDKPTNAPDAFLNAHLRFTTDEHGQEVCLVNTGKNEDEEVGVMMGWERGISELTQFQIERNVLIDESAGNRR